VVVFFIYISLNVVKSELAAVNSFVIDAMLQKMMSTPTCPLIQRALAWHMAVIWAISRTSHQRLALITDAIKSEFIGKILLLHHSVTTASKMYQAHVYLGTKHV